MISNEPEVNDILDHSEYKILCQLLNLYFLSEKRLNSILFKMKKTKPQAIDKLLSIIKEQKSSGYFSLYTDTQNSFVDQFFQSLKTLNSANSSTLNFLNEKLSQTNKAYYLSEKQRSENYSDEKGFTTFPQIFTKSELPLKEEQDIPSPKKQKENVGLVSPIKKQRKKKNNTDIYCKDNCMFTRKDGNQKMIMCDGKCKTWYHLECVGLNDEKMQQYEGKNWYCDICVPLNESKNN